VVYTYSCTGKLHIICICNNEMWAVRCSIVAVSDICVVRQHCVNTNRYNTQHTCYTLCISIKLTGNYKLHAAQCFWSCHQPHSQSGNIEQERSLPCAQQPSTFPYPELDESNHIPRSTIYLTSTLILSSHLRLCLSSSFLPSRCPPKIHNLYFKHVSCSQ